MALFLYPLFLKQAHDAACRHRKSYNFQLIHLSTATALLIGRPITRSYYVTFLGLEYVDHFQGSHKEKITARWAGVISRQ